ncbi:MAG: sugar transferase [Geminicoccaceae bacterium]
MLSRLSWPRRRIAVLHDPLDTEPQGLRDWLRHDLGTFIAVEMIPFDRALGRLKQTSFDEILILDAGTGTDIAPIVAALEMMPQRSRCLRRRGQEVELLELVAPALDWKGRLLKRSLDVVGASLLLVFLTPLMLVTALAIKIDSRGPVFFRQPRFGLGCQIFDCLKFRSMYADRLDVRADRLTTRGDPRVTRVGAFIRRTSIDELPQLFNVLKGEMSLVGPRPHPVQAKAGERLYEEVVEDFARRYRVQPGLTGLAQVTGLRGNTDTEEKLVRRFESDIAYIRSWSIRLDLKILLRTPWASLKGENAY